jgi:cellobiose transport system substrate-binding protein
MLGVVAGNAEGVKGWDFADVFPGGGGNWGGSYLVVPTQSEHPDEA